MKLSVVIPYYNGERWIGKCLDSLLNQDLPVSDYEIIVVDDGSTNSVEMLLDYSRKYENIKYARQPNAGQSAARNHGLDMARGEYVFFLDCDDYVVPNVIRKVLGKAIDNQADVICYNIIYQKFNEGEKPLKSNWESVDSFPTGLDFLSSSFGRLRSGPEAFFARRGFLKSKHVRFDESMKMREDERFWLEMICAAGKVVKVEADICYYVQHPESFVHLIGKKHQNTLFVDNIVKYILFLRELLSRLKVELTISASCIDKFNDAIHGDSFIVLHNTFRYGSLKRNWQMMRCIKNLDVYPIRLKTQRYRYILFLMNRPVLWYISCVIFHVIPKTLRYKYF